MKKLAEETAGVGVNDTRKLSVAKGQKERLDSGGLQSWTRVDYGARHLLTTNPDGPAWDSVT